MRRLLVAVIVAAAGLLVVAVAANASDVWWFDVQELVDPDAAGGDASRWVGGDFWGYGGSGCPVR